MAPKRILSIDGGGLRGVVALAFLEVIEDELRKLHGPRYRLRDHYDLIGGTSTGALIATAIALGKRPRQIRRLYRWMAPRVFRRSFDRVKFLRPVFHAEKLERYVGLITRDRTLDTPDLRPGGLAIVTKRVDTGSVWFLTNNSAAKFWNGSPEHLPNSGYLLRRVVRASAAAPIYFAPQEIRIAEGEKPGIFVDGAVSPHNNPALALFQIATIPAYGYGWKTGPANLDITSIGTGTYRHRMTPGLLQRIAAMFAVKALESMMADCDAQVMTLMQALGECDNRWTINGEIGDLSGVCIAAEPLFRFRRYNIELEANWLKSELGAGDGEVTPAKLKLYRRMDSVTAMPKLHEFALRAAKRQVRLAVQGEQQPA